MSQTCHPGNQEHQGGNGRSINTKLFSSKHKSNRPEEHDAADCWALTTICLLAAFALKFQTIRWTRVYEKHFLSALFQHSAREKQWNHSELLLFCTKRLNFPVYRHLCPNKTKQQHKLNVWTCVIRNGTGLFVIDFRLCENLGYLYIVNWPIRSNQKAKTVGVWIVSTNLKWSLAKF